MANLTATETQKQTELLFALHHRDRPTVVFLEANSPRKATELESFLTQNLPEYKFYTIDLTPHPTVSLLRVLTEQLPAEVVQSEPVTYSVNIKGLENSLLMNRDGRIEPSMLTAQLNLERELLFRNVPYNILIWADSHFFKTLQREAPDLWSWVTYKFRFEDTEALTDPSDRPDQHPPLPTKRLVQRGNIAERQVRIRELEDTLSRLNQNTADKIRLQRDKISIFSLLGQEYQEAFDFEKAEKAYQNAFAIAERIHADDFQLGELSFNLAGVYLDTQRFDKALTLYERAMGYSKEQQFGAVFHQIGRAYAEQRQWGLALENYQQAIDWKTKTGNEFALGSTYHQIGMVYQEQRQWSLALENYQQAIDWKTKTGNEFALGSTYHQIGRAYAEQRQWSLALENYQQAIDWNTKTGNEFELGGTYHQIGRMYEEQRQWSLALENYQQAIDWNTKTGNEFELGGTYHQIGRAYAEQRQWSLALENYQQAIDWNTKTGNEFELGGTYHQIGSVYEEQNELETALQWYEEAVLNMSDFISPNLPIADESLDRVSEQLRQQQDAL